MPGSGITSNRSKEAKDEIVVEIMRRRKTGETWDSIAVAMGRKEACLKTLTYSSAHHKAYKAKLNEEKKKESGAGGGFGAA